jgi:hypothetical protein
MAYRAVDARLRLAAIGIVLAWIPIILLVVVIPPILKDTFKGANLGPAAIAFAVSALLHAAVGIFACRSSRTRGAISAWMGVITVILGLILMDGGFAFRAHGPAMRLAVFAIFTCVVADFVAAAIIFVMSFLRSRALGKPIQLMHRS